MACRVYIIGVFFLSGLLLPVAVCNENHELRSAICPSHKGSDCIRGIPLKDSSSQKNKKTRHPSSEGLSSLNNGIVVIGNWSNFKPDWCRDEQLEQTISEKGCKSRVIVNRFCYGQCNSFYIPGYAYKGDILFKSFSSCVPDEFSIKLMVLSCPGRRPPWKEKKITRVKRCRCRSIDVK